MLKIRLQRVGKKHEPVFRLVVCDSKNSVKSGNNLEVLGAYDARDKNETRINADRVNHWIAQGAQLSDTVHNLLITKGIIKGKKINILPAFKTPEKTEEETKKESVDTAQNKSEDVEVKEENTNEEIIEQVKEEAPVETDETAVEVKEEEIPAEAADSGKEDSVEVKEEELPAETQK
jgi:small subunit ribosomal protein S16